MTAEIVPGGATSDDHLVALWLHGRSSHSARAYLADAARFRRGAGKPLSHITLAELQGFAESLSGLAPASRYRTLSAVKSLLAFGHRIGYLPYDVGRVLHLPSLRDRLAERILAEDEVQRILSLEPDRRNRVLLTLLYASGVRVSELCGLHWRDVQPAGECAQITVFGKGGKTRAVLLPAKISASLNDLRGISTAAEPIFRSRKKGAGLKPLAVLRIVRRAAQRAGIELNVSPHWLRHAHASHALDHGAPISLVQQTLGHASVQTTGRYLHARPKESSSRFLPL